MNLKHNSIAAAAVLLACSASANAANITSLLTNGMNHLSDNSADQLIDNNGNTTLDVGDRLRGIFTIDSLENINGAVGLGVSTPNHELAGLFDIEVASKVFLGGTSYSWTFKPTATFESIYGTGAMVAFYEDATAEFSRLSPAGGGTCTTPGAGGDCEANVIDGTLFWVAGQVAGNPNNFWSAFSAAGDSPTVLGSDASGGLGGFYNLGLSQLVGGTGPALGLRTCAGGSSNAVCGSGSLLSKGSESSPYDNFDNVDFYISVNKVPEPAVLGLMGLGLIGMAAGRRKKTK